MRIPLVLITTVSLMLSTIAATAGSIEFEEAGFSIDTLDIKTKSPFAQPITMALPAKGGFAANVNVQIQEYPGTLQEYLDLSVGQLDQMGLRILDQSISDAELVMEYEGVMQGRLLHFYAKAVKRGKSVYLATATDSADNWANTAAELKSVVDSLKLK
ncbi:hypothetical protein HF888_10860 [Bermanella marisrubri]|uniref:DUF1795 domain-containing protein n=1 Tax=Bermanella marisrubri TaxID=207949 RepID=Q1N5K9_9GAMM|nr:hypothetical protein [Bermanella marisrubri]EAT13933.1 hypothetical protein RED65_11084 [Oceanobacter sp. RED65] [Bermanella marisrubri]QIZ84684.1 hypothetical protein HF888_10860 [Bermanella marisrubri]